MTKVACIFGTRPEAIKMAPIVIALQQSQKLSPEVCVTGQHRAMLDQVLELFEIKPDHDLDLMRPGQNLAGLTSRALTALDEYLAKSKPDFILVQGDTTTAFCGALSALYHRVPVGHVEAGLRTNNLLSPWPEEANRRLISAVTALHFPPTSWSRDNLLKEGIDPSKVLVTGNTVIDALLTVRDNLSLNPPFIDGLPEGLQPSTGPQGRRIVLITGHRRENFGDGFESICRSIRELAGRFPDVSFVYPVHLNPQVREPVFRILGGENMAPNVHLIEPLDYRRFVALMNRSHLILTDSGGVQEEAPSLGKPVLVMRDTTERPEAVEAGTARLVGTDFHSITHGVALLLEDDSAYAAMAHALNPYGDGSASDRIVSGIEQFFGILP